MSKQIQTVDNKSSESETSAKNIHWEECVICQERTREDLQCPAEKTGPDLPIGAGYKSFDINIQRCCAMNWFPSKLNLELLNEGSGIADTLQKNKAKWHKSCINKFSDLKISRQEKRKRDQDVEAESSFGNISKVTRHSCGDSTKTMTEGCFFCGDKTGDLHEASTFMIDKRVRECALELQDTVLLAKLSAGDLISQEAKYHAKCLIRLYNMANRQNQQTSKDSQESVVHGIVLAELLEYIESSRSEADVIPIFKLADLAKMYSTRLGQLGVAIEGRVNTTHLKNRIVSALPDMQAHKQCRDVLLIFKDDVGEALKRATSLSRDDEGIILAKASKIVRRDMLDTKYSFTGTFNDNCQKESVPQTLTSLVGMILGGPNIDIQSSNIVESQTTLTISQLLQFNCAIRRRKTAAATHHSTEREPPLPIYLGMVIHAETRKRDLVDKLYSLGLSISYERVMNISTAMGNSVCEMFQNDGVVCPAKLRYNVFTTSAVDNIDHNPSSTTATGSLHGTAISLFQHPSVDNHGTERVTACISEKLKRENIKELPESYSVVPPVILPKEPSVIPSVDSLLVSDCKNFKDAQELEYRWLNHVRQELEDSDRDTKNITWSAFHANLCQSKDAELTLLDISSMLPLFQEEAKSTAMIRHSMTIIQECVSFLNPGQIPVMACDQPLYAIAKKIQWTWPERYGENLFIVMFGGLHIEIAAFRIIGDWLQNSGWVSALSQANVASAGTAESFLKASHVTRTRHAHQVTACSLHILMHKAYRQYLDEADETETVQFPEWKEMREIESPLFHFWSLTLKLELIILIFVRSLRERNFTLYKDSLTMLIPWFFALDHPNYARWLPIHVRDMLALDNTAPRVASEFEKGHFVVHKTHSAFSSISIDHAHEQNNKLVKGEGGVIGLTESAPQLLRWMVCGPEIARAVNEFELSQELIRYEQSKGPDIRHHEQIESKQKAFVDQVRALTDTLEEMGNPFLEKSDDLLVLDTRDIADPEVAQTVRNIEQIGESQYQEFVKNRLEKKTKPLADPIKQNKLHLFSRQELRIDSKEKQQISSLKQNCSLFSQLYVSCQVRDGDLDEFFRHENQAYPPSLSQFGQLRFGSKSDLLVPLEKMSKSETESPDVDAIILDGAAIVNMLKPRFCKTFEDYSKQIFLPHIDNFLKVCSRVDVVWDEYRQDSLKTTARGKRGKGIRRRVQAESTIPGNWESFLRIDDNKTELFAYLAEQILTLTSGYQKTVISTIGREIVCNKPNKETSKLSPCNHEEADTRMFLHVADLVNDGIQRIMIRTVDTDVVVIAISVIHKLDISSLWIAFGVGKNFRYIPVHEIAVQLGPYKSRALLFFHAFTGCDQVSSFCNHGKKTAWETWSTYNEVTNEFNLLSDKPSEDCVKESVENIERFVVLLYDRSSECLRVDAARKDLFTRKGRSIDNIPPSSSALQQHIKRAAYQAGYCWGQALDKIQEAPSPGSWGWKRSKDGSWEPFWTALKQASESCAELIKCGCKSENGCRGRCKCVKAALSCTALCKCGGQCDRE